jgi:hypothetical protein
MTTTVKDLEQQVQVLTQTVDKLVQSITTFNNTGNRKLDEALKVKIFKFVCLISILIYTNLDILQHNESTLFYRKILKTLR